MEQYKVEDKFKILDWLRLELRYKKTDRVYRVIKMYAIIIGSMEFVFNTKKEINLLDGFKKKFNNFHEVAGQVKEYKIIPKEKIEQMEEDFKEIAEILNKNEENEST